MAERGSVVIVARGSIGGFGRLSNRVRRKSVEDPNAADIERPTIVRVESFGLWRKRLDDLVQDASEMRLGSLPVVLDLKGRI